MVRDGYLGLLKWKLWGVFSANLTARQIQCKEMQSDIDKISIENEINT